MYSIGRACRLTLTIGMITWLGGCATPADPALMMVGPATADNRFPDALRHTMCVRNVTGGEETNPLWTSKVNDRDFRAALTASLDAAGLTVGSESCTYAVDVNLLGLAQPVMGFDMEVTSHVNYKVSDPVGQPVLQETISASYTAAVSESLNGMVRLKRANEGSVRASISQFLEKLRTLNLPAT